MPQYLVTIQLPDNYDPSLEDEAKIRDIFALGEEMEADLLMKMGRFTEAREEIERAITMTQNLREQQLLTERLKQIERRRQHRCGSVLRNAHGVSQRTRN